MNILEPKINKMMTRPKKQKKCVDFLTKKLRIFITSVLIICKLII
jgi:hypothetical protein